METILFFFLLGYSMQMIANVIMLWKIFSQIKGHGRVNLTGLAIDS